jgi:hypothetical protein
MDFDPQKWFINALLFFGVLAPGLVAVAILAELARQWGAALPMGWPPASTFEWSAFLVAGFICGYLAHPPSHVLNALYDRTYRVWRRRLGDPLVDEVRKIAGAEVGPGGSLYDWSKRRLKSKSPNDLARVETMEGISKGFRTLALIAAIGVVLAGATGEVEVSLACLIGFGLAFLVFCERRFAATCEAYGSVIDLERTAESLPASGTRDRSQRRKS